MARVLRWRDVWGARLAAQCLDQPAPAARLTDVVCGIHAQVAASADLSMCWRVSGITQADVRTALWTARSLVKTYGLRGTLHIFPAPELAFWLAALRARVPPRPPNPTETAALPAERLDEVVAAIGDALDGQQLTRNELGGELEEVDLDGWHAYWSRNMLSEIPTTARTVHLLPRFDCYIVGCHPRRQLIPATAPAPLLRGTAAPFQVLIVDGVVAGLWEQQRRGTELRIRVDPFDRLSASEYGQLELGAQRMAEFYGVRAELELGHVEPRGHM